MPFRYSVVVDTLRFLGYDALESPREVFGAIKEAGYDGVDLPGDLGPLSAADMKGILAQYGLKVPAIQGAWAYFHAGENRDLCGADESAGPTQATAGSARPVSALSSPTSLSAWA